jgi:hypothetical protein
MMAVRCRVIEKFISNRNDSHATSSESVRLLCLMQSRKSKAINELSTCPDVSS